LLSSNGVTGRSAHDVFHSVDELTIETAIRTVAAAFEQADLFYGHGTDNALDEASWLVLHAMALSPALAPDYSRRLSQKDRDSLIALMTRRIEQRVPMALACPCAAFAIGIIHPA